MELQIIALFLIISGVLALVAFYRSKPTEEEIQQELEKEEALKQQYANMTDEQLIQIGVKKDEKWETEKAERRKARRAMIEEMDNNTMTSPRYSNLSTNMNYRRESPFVK